MKRLNFDVHFGKVTDKTPDWRRELKDEEYADDDEQLAETPEEVVKMLGFDPLELEDV